MRNKRRDLMRKEIAGEIEHVPAPDTHEMLFIGIGSKREIIKKTKRDEDNEQDN